MKKKFNRREFLKGFTIGAIIGSPSLFSEYNQPHIQKKIDFFKKKEKSDEEEKENYNNFLKKKNKNYEAPIFENIPPNYCSRYARLAAKKLTGAEYVPANAWDFAEKNRLVKEISGNLEDYQDLLIPGRSVVLFYNPNSKYNLPERKGTHLALYLGSENEKLMFAEEFGTKQRKISLEEMINRNKLTPKEIIDVKK